MKVAVYNQKGEELSQVLLPKEIFGLKVKSDLLHQVVISQRANRRLPLAHTKDRSEVAGGGKKPWRQKGTGRARHGSIRSPLWRGGGVTFGPRKERVFKKIIPKKMKRQALFMSLAAKADNNLLIVLDKIVLEKTKTKEMAKIIADLRKNISHFKKGSILLALPNCDKKIILASRNLPDIQTSQAKDLNALDLLSFKYLLLTKDAIKIIKETFSKEE